MLKIPGDNIDIDWQNLVAISCLVSSRFAATCLLQPEQRTLLDESAMIRTQMKKH
jgi:hypothetical protein